MTSFHCSITPTAESRVIAPYARTLWDTALAEGVPQAALSRVLGGEIANDGDVPVQGYLAMLELALAHCGPCFGWRLGQSVKPTSYGVNGILLLACTTLGEALEQVLRFESLVHDLGRSTLQRDGALAMYTWRNDYSSHPTAAALVESVFSGIQTCAQWLVGRRIEGVQLEFMHRRDAVTAQAIVHASGVQLRWGAETPRALFPAALLDWPLAHPSQGLLPLLQRHADALLQARHPHAQGVVAQVRRCIANGLGQQGVRLADVAQALHLSPRTLQRRLAETGVAFQTLLDETRHQLACHYLRDSDMVIAELGQLLGYQETAAFHHAFKQWQGCSPGVYRQAAQRRP